MTNEAISAGGNYIPTPQQYIERASLELRLPSNNVAVEKYAALLNERDVLNGEIVNLNSEVESTRGRLLAAESQLAEAKIKLGEAKIDRRSGLLRNDAYEDLAAIELAQIKGFAEKRRDVPNQAVMIFGDLVEFGNFNREFGHGAGDKVISNIGELLIKFLRPNSRDMAGRIGEGDEFSMVIFFRADDQEELEKAHKTINERLYEIVYQATQEGYITGFKWCSAVYDSGETYDELKKRVDPKFPGNETPAYSYPIVAKKV